MVEFDETMKTYSGSGSSESSPTSRGGGTRSISSSNSGSRVKPNQQSRSGTSGSQPQQSMKISTGGSISWPSTPKNSTVLMKSPPSPFSSNSSTGGSVKSPSSPRIILPTGNIYPQGDVKTGMAGNSNKTDKLGPGAGYYKHNHIMRAGAVTKNVSESSAKSTEIAYGNDPEDLPKLGNEEYNKGNFEGASGFYDRVISLLPTNASYKANRVAALMSLEQLEEELKECQEAVKLDPAHARANHCLSYLLKRPA